MWSILPWEADNTFLKHEAFEVLSIDCAADADDPEAWPARSLLRCGSGTPKGMPSLMRRSSCTAARPAAAAGSWWVRCIRTARACTKTGATITKSGHFKTNTWWDPDTGLAWSASDAAYVAPLPRATLLGPVTPTVAVANKYFTVSGVLRPHHEAGQYWVSLYFEKLVAGKWYGLKPIGAMCSDADAVASTRFSASAKLPAGTWRVRAYHSDADHSPTWTVYKTVVVK